ncbi:Aldedh domain-containing protein [Mycena indigotica]|uniref:Aldedh domain-containing protein n=1 Tax=Mycena indigotica TaxID=2126181 RepID=A0A8H6S627_9AGAR|nr:Aldedh domain-containing protein [Mycena indigotica]KAF7291970.1 Aldedh domain-containing protein [Mycena indigotica]
MSNAQHSRSATAATAETTFKEEPTLSLAGTRTDLEYGEMPSTAGRISLWQHLNTDVDPAECTGPLAAFCFMTGFIDCISFSAIFVWCGFQTGNFAQLALALARLWEPSPTGSGHNTEFHIADRQALTSLLTFNIGAFFGRFGDRIGSHKRIWLVGATLLQVLFTAAAAIAIWQSNQGSVAEIRGDPSWTGPLTYLGIAFMSASLGLQGIQGKRLNTQFTTTIVLTTVWVELVTDPRLFNLRQKVITRDHKLIAAVALFTGAFVARAILASAGAPTALGVGAGIRVLIALSWIVIPGKKLAKA